MKVSSHAAVLEPIRSAPERTVGASSSASAVPIRTTLHPSVPAASDPFTDIFKKFVQTATSSLKQPVSTPATAAPNSTAAASSGAVTATETASTTPAASSTAAASGTAATSTVSAPVQTSTGIQALVNAIVSGSIQVSYDTNPSQLTESTPVGTALMPSLDYVSDQTAQQMAQLLGGTVVQMAPYGTGTGFSNPPANFIQLPNGMLADAADLAPYCKGPIQSPAQLTASVTAVFNADTAWQNFYSNGGSLPMYSTGYIGPPISGMSYPPGTIGSDGNVINPAMES